MKKYLVLILILIILNGCSSSSDPPKQTAEDFWKNTLNEFTAACINKNYSKIEELSYNLPSDYQTYVNTKITNIESIIYVIVNSYLEDDMTKQEFTLLATMGIFYKDNTHKSDGLVLPVKKFDNQWKINFTAWQEAIDT